MTDSSKFDITAIKTFDRNFESTYEDLATHSRGEFLRAFPINRLSRMTLEEYVIGHQSPTFCTHVEVKTRPWANIQGAAANKFGIYFGKTKVDAKKKYRFTAKFGATADEAFVAVKRALIALVRLGKAPDLDFQAIDESPLSQMFKAKILSLYFPEKFLNVCSADHLRMLAAELGFEENLPVSEYQHLLLRKKLQNTTTRKWSNPKFMAFLYTVYIDADDTSVPQKVQAPRKKSHRKVNFEDIQAQRDAIGKAAENFALQWEKQRLEGADLASLIAKIEDLRDFPSYGYDFLSHSADTVPRFIEVKSVRKLSNGEGLRFFLSENEHLVSRSDSHRDGYFFYLVLFDGESNPVDLIPVRVEDMYQNCEMQPASYVVRFDLS